MTADAAAGGVAENSFAAVAEAQAVGVEFVESDCHLTLDGTVVLFHDDDLRRVTGDPRKVAEVDQEELAAIMADRGGLLTLEQALDSFPELRFNIDVKSAAAAAPTGRLVAPHVDRVLLTSFSDARRTEAVRVATELAGRPPATSPGQGTLVRLLLALAGGAKSRATARILHELDALQVPERRGALRIVTPRLIDAAHRHGVEVHVWTVNDVDDMRRLIGAGVDGIVTDRADVGLRLSV